MRLRVCHAGSTPRDKGNDMNLRTRHAVGMALVGGTTVTITATDLAGLTNLSPLLRLALSVGMVILCVSILRDGRRNARRNTTEGR
ncbi:membrane protein [Streptomyces phage Mischief19]|nr:membrane protein [Streptomyces phage Mischief19]